MLPARCRRCLALRCGPDGLGSSQGPIIEPDEASSVCTLELAKLASDGNFKIYGMFMRINKGTLKLFHGWRWGPHSQNFNHLFVWWGMWTFSGISILFSEGIDLKNTIEGEFKPIPYWVYEVCVFKFNIYNIESRPSIRRGPVMEVMQFQDS